MIVRGLRRAMRRMRRNATGAGDAAINARGEWLIWIKEIRGSMFIMRLSAPVEARSG